MDVFVDRLKALRSKNPKVMAIVRRVPVEAVLGVSTRDNRRIAKMIGKDRKRAELLWQQSFFGNQGARYLDGTDKRCRCRFDCNLGC